ncbi:MAG: hypothetical protein EPN85_14515, partial [Bacteroidetes bacterium]
MKKTLFIVIGFFFRLTLFSQQNYLDNYLTGTVTYTNIAGSAQQISLPRDLDFKPGTNELWVCNKGTSGTTNIIIFNAGLPGQTSVYRKDSDASHFWNYGSAFAFGEDGTFGTIGESTNGGDLFAGPSLWTGDTAIFAKVFQGTSGMLGSHLDMLHQSPNGMGMAYDNAWTYWLFDGQNGNICKYDFSTHHGPGNTGHGNGKIWRYTDVTVSRVPNVASHMVMDKANEWLYFVGGSNKTLKRLKTTSGTNSGNLSATSEPLAGYYNMTGATVETIETFTTQPSGVDFYNNRLIISDYTNGNIIIYNTTTTPLTKLGTITTGQSGIMGVKVGPDGKIWFVNYTANTVVRMDPAAPSADDAGIINITSPITTDFESDYYGLKADVCGSSITPVVTLKNNGSNALTAVTINAKIDNGTPVPFSWTGSLASGATTSVTLPAIAVTGGGHKLTVSTASPNGNTDPNLANDSKGGSFRSEQLATFPFSEGFTSTTFPPDGWDYISIDNPLAYMSRNGTVGGFGNSAGCVKMEVFATPYSNFGQVDYLMTPQIDLTTAPSSGTVLEFSMAYRQYDSGTNETLKVLVSANCGGTWTTIYNKSGSTLSTGTATTSAFTPTAAQWRKESVSLTPYVGQSVIFAFATTCDFGNNIYFDDIVVTNPAVGISENTSGLPISMYPNPAHQFVTLSGTDLNNSNVSVYSLMGTP